MNNYDESEVWQWKIPITTSVVLNTIFNNVNFHYNYMLYNNV